MELVELQNRNGMRYKGNHRYHVGKGLRKGIGMESSYVQHKKRQRPLAEIAIREMTEILSSRLPSQRGEAKDRFLIWQPAYHVINHEAFPSLRRRLN